MVVPYWAATRCSTRPSVIGARFASSKWSTLRSVKALPEDFETGALIPSLAAGWGFDAEWIDYAPVGFPGATTGSATGPGGSRGFVTVDDLEPKALARRDS